MAEQSNTVTIKLTKGRAFENIIGEQELKSQREALKGKGFNVIPIRDQQGNILGFEDEFQQGFDLKTPTALSPEQRRAQESGFQKGFAPEQEEDDLGRPDLSKSVQASTELSKQIKEAESKLLKIQGKSSADFARIAKKRNLKLGDVLKLAETETERIQDFVTTLKDKKTTLDELVFGKKKTPSELLAEKKAFDARPKRKIVDIETGEAPTKTTTKFKDVPIETEKEKAAREKTKAKKTENQLKALKRISEIDAKIVSIKKGKKLTAIEGLGLLLSPELAKKFKAGEDIPIQDAIDSLLTEKEFLLPLAGETPDKEKVKSFGKAVDPNTGEKAPEGLKFKLTDGTRVIVKDGIWIENKGI